MRHTIRSFLIAVAAICNPTWSVVAAASAPATLVEDCPSSLPTCVDNSETATTNLEKVEKRLNASTSVNEEEIDADAHSHADADDVDTTTTDESTQFDKNIAYDGSDLIEWINSNGGFIHPNARIGLDPTGQYRGVFVKNVGDDEDGGTAEGIKDDDIIAKIPWDLIVKPLKYRYNDFGTNCDALHEMYRQFQLGDESKYAPYINYLKNQPAGRIPSEWSESGKHLLRRILDQEEGKVGLPPYDALDRFEQIWMKECQGEDTPLARAAFFQFTSRDEDTLMVPFYDMHNHSNDPKKLNTISWKPEKEGEDFTLHAIRNIVPGEQILISYNRCHGCWFDTKYKDCETRSFGGTDHLFNQFGFVEDYPQFWILPQFEDNGKLFDEVLFCLDRHDDDDDDDEDQLVVRRFGENRSHEPDEIPVEENLIWLREHVMRLQELEGMLKNDGELKKSMPSYEWETSWQYHTALVTAMSTAIDAAKEAAEDVFGSQD